MKRKWITGLLVVGAVLGFSAYKGIKAVKIKAKYDNGNALGFDWDTVLNHSADPIDFAKQLKRELKWAWQRVKRGMTTKYFGTLTIILTK